MLETFSEKLLSSESMSGYLSVFKGCFAVLKDICLYQQKVVGEKYCVIKLKIIFTMRLMM